MIDTPRHQGMRRRMVEELRAKGLYCDEVLEAMNAVPRHLFIDPSFEDIAYEDRAMPIGCQQTISQPSTVALQSHCLALEPGMKVMEIGTGSGYQTAVLCQMGAKVFTIERQYGLFRQATPVFQYLDRHLHLRPAQRIVGDGFLGVNEWQDYAPFDRIIITCGAPEIPPALVDQLKVGGLMVIPLADEMTLYRKTNGAPKILTLGNCRFVPMLKDVQSQTP